MHVDPYLVRMRKAMLDQSTTFLRQRKAEEEEDRDAIDAILTVVDHAVEDEASAMRASKENLISPFRRSRKKLTDWIEYLRSDSDHGIQQIGRERKRWKSCYEFMLVCFVVVALSSAVVFVFYVMRAHEAQDLRLDLSSYNMPPKYVNWNHYFSTSVPCTAPDDNMLWRWCLDQSMNVNASKLFFADIIAKHMERLRVENTWLNFLCAPMLTHAHNTPMPCLCTVRLINGSYVSLICPTIVAESDRKAIIVDQLPILSTEHTRVRRTIPTWVDVRGMTWPTSQCERTTVRFDREDVNTVLRAIAFLTRNESLLFSSNLYINNEQR